MTDLPSHSPSSVVSPQSECNSIWLALLRNCVVGTGALALVFALISFMVTGVPAFASVLIVEILVILFFGVSLLVAHFYGKKNPSGVIGTFLPLYVAKVVVLGVFLWLVPRPDWFESDWALWSAIAIVVAWQAIEIFTFACSRQLIFDEPQKAGE